MSKVSKSLQHIDQLLNSGSLSETRNQIVALSKVRRLPREARLRLANFARRAHMPGKAVMLLHRTVRPGNGQRDGGTLEERCEYAASLTMIGSPKEAYGILEAIDAPKMPLVWYFKALVAVWQWDWEASIAPFEQFVRVPEINDDLRLSAKFFWANSLTQGPGDYARADQILRELLTECGPNQHRLVYKNALLNLLQNETLWGNSKSANQIYDRIEREELDDQDPLFVLVVEQWKATNDLLSASTHQKQEPAKRLQRIINAYRADRRWENARGAEYQLAAALKDREALLYLGYGTPYPSFRAKAFAQAQALAPGSALPEFCDRLLWESRKNAVEPVIDSADGRTELSSKAYLKPGFLLQRLLATLAADFYKPLQITELHEALYPGEKYLPHATPERIHQLVLRLRLWFEEHRLPIEIEERFGAYSLSARSPLRIRVWEPSSLIVQEKSRLNPEGEAACKRLLSKFRAEPFSAGQAAQTLDIPLRSTIRLLNEALAAGMLSRSGRARATRYQVEDSEV